MNLQKNLSLWLLLLAIALTLGIRLLLINEPVERNEATNIVITKQLLEGKTLYKDIWDSNSAFLYYSYMIPLFLSDSIIAARLFTAIAVIATMLILYAAAKRISGSIAGLSVAALYGVFSSLPLIQGNNASTELLSNALIASAFYFTISAAGSDSRKHYLLAGVFATAAFLITPAAFPIIIAAAVAPLLEKKQARSITVLKAAIATAAIAGILLALKGILKEAVFAALTYSIKHATYPLSIVAQAFSTIKFLSLEQGLFWLAAVYAIYILFKTKHPVAKTTAAFFIAGIISIFALKTAFPHNFLYILPVAAFATGIFLSSIGRQKAAYATAAIIILALLADSSPLTASPAELSRIKYGTTVFSQAEEAGMLIQKTSNYNDQLYVWGSEPEIYYHSKRPPASRFITSAHLDPAFVKGNELLIERRKELLEELYSKKPRIIIATAPYGDFPALAQLLNESYTRERVFLYKKEGVEAPGILLLRRR